jgi:hypothetical protein
VISLAGFLLWPSVRAVVSLGKLLAISGAFLLAAVAGAVTNDFPKDSGGRDANATVGTDGPAGVKLRFEHHGTLVEIERGFRPSSHRLQIGGKTFHKEADVRRELSAFLAVADVVLRDFVFVRQGELAAFLTASASHRADAFHEVVFHVHAETRLPRGVEKPPSRRPQLRCPLQACAREN